MPKLTTTTETAKREATKHQSKGQQKKAAGKASKTKTRARRAEQKEQELQQRPIKHPKTKATICEGESELTAAQAKELVGWDTQNVTDTNFDLKDLEGNKVRLWNNPRNRPFDMLLCKLWMSEILSPGIHKGQVTRSRWRQNGQTLVIGQTAITVSAQHRLVALILAAQEWHLHPERWPNWECEPTMPCIIIFGIEEDDDVVNTIDTGKPRTFADVLYRSDLFAAMEKKERANAARITSNAVKVLFDRSGAGVKLYSAKCSHTEMINFLYRHERVLECVKHIHDENAGSKAKISTYLTQGDASALLYLMGSGQSDRQIYLAETPPSEEVLDWSLFEKAKEFWVELAANSKTFLEVRNAVSRVADEGEVVAAHEFKQRKIAVLVKAWHAYSNGRPLTPQALNLDYVKDDDGNRHLTNLPLTGGIDIGSSRDMQEPDSTEEDPTPEEIEQRKAAIANENGKRKASGGKASASKPSASQPMARSTNGEFKVGDEVFVKDRADGGTWKGVLTQLGSERGKATATVRVAQGFAGAGSMHTVPLDTCHHEHP